VIIPTERFLVLRLIRQHKEEMETQKDELLRFLHKQQVQMKMKHNQEMSDVKNDHAHVINDMTMETEKLVIEHENFLLERYDQIEIDCIENNRELIEQVEDENRLLFQEAVHEKQNQITEIRSDYEGKATALKVSHLLDIDNLRASHLRELSKVDDETDVAWGRLRLDEQQHQSTDSLFTLTCKEHM
jgi:hypothetical protein